MAPTTWIIVAFVTALVVMVLAATVSGTNRRGVGQFFSDVRTGLRREPDAGGISLVASARQELADAADDDDDLGVDDIFHVGAVPDSAYVDPTPLTAPIARVTRSLGGRVRS